MARVRILAFKKDDKWINLLTVITECVLSASLSKFKVINKYKNSDNEAVIIEGHINNNDIKNFKHRIIVDQNFVHRNYCINFDTEKTTRESFLLNAIDQTTWDNCLIRSRFVENAILFENWCINDEIKNIWYSFSQKMQKELSKELDIDLYTMIDRVGNLLHIKELNEINIDIIHQNDKFITFSTYMNDVFIPGKYFATIQIKSFDDIILNKGFIVNERFIDFELQDEDYEISVTVYNMETNECVYKKTFSFSKGIHYIMNVAGPGVIFKDQSGNEIHSIQTYSSERNSVITNKNHSKQVQYQQIRSQWARKLKNRESMDFKRFKGNESDKAFDYLNKLLRQLENLATSYIYVADPYFWSAEFNLKRFINYLNIFSSVQNKEVRFLTCCKEKPRALKHFIKRNKDRIFSNIKIKSVFELSEKYNEELPAFHDRWIASKNEEYGITNSLNNFKKGVSFFRSYEHYFDEAEFLWNISLDNPHYKIEEFNLYE